MEYKKKKNSAFDILIETNIFYFPVDIFGLIRKLGINLYRLNDARYIAVSQSQQKPPQASIYINQKDKSVNGLCSQRFIGAVSLYYILSEENDHQTLIKSLDDCNNEAFTSAISFAEDLLIPEEAFIQYSAIFQSEVESLKTHFRVPESIIRKKLKKILNFEF